MEKPFFQIEVDDSGLRTLLNRLQDQMSDMTPVMQIIGEIAKTSIKKNFEEGGRYSEAGSWKGGSQRWQPLSISTLFAGKKSKYVTKSGRYRKGVEERFRSSNRHILVKEGILMGSINYRASRDEVEAGTNVVYGAIHNFGGPAGRGLQVQIPARPYLVLQDEDLEEMGRVILEHIVDG